MIYADRDTVNNGNDKPFPAASDAHKLRIRRALGWMYHISRLVELRTYNIKTVAITEFFDLYSYITWRFL